MSVPHPDVPKGLGINGERRLNTWLTTEASLALARLSKRYGVKQREILERVISAEGDRILAAMVPGSPEWRYASTASEVRYNETIAFQGCCNADK